jgi:hypothetical protein
MEADLQPLATSGVVTRISSYCANPANPPQSPHCPASGTTHPRERGRATLAVNFRNVMLTQMQQPCRDPRGRPAYAFTQGIGPSPARLVDAPVAKWRVAKMPLLQGRHAPPVHMIRLIETRKITPYVWVHPDEE